MTPLSPSVSSAITNASVAANQPSSSSMSTRSLGKCHYGSVFCQSSSSCVLTTPRHWAARCAELDLRLVSQGRRYRRGSSWLCLFSFGWCTCGEGDGDADYLPPHCFINDVFLCLPLTSVFVWLGLYAFLQLIVLSVVNWVGTAVNHWWKDNRTWETFVKIQRIHGIISYGIKWKYEWHVSQCIDQ